MKILATFLILISTAAFSETDDLSDSVSSKPTPLSKFSPTPAPTVTATATPKPSPSRQASPFAKPFPSPTPSSARQVSPFATPVPKPTLKSTPKSALKTAGDGPPPPPEEAPPPPPAVSEPEPAESATVAEFVKKQRERRRAFEETLHKRKVEFDDIIRRERKLADLEDESTLTSASDRKDARKSIKEKKDKRQENWKKRIDEERARVRKERKEFNDLLEKELKAFRESH